MFKVEYLSLDTPPRVVLLCNSTRSLAEHNIRLNHRRVIEVVDFVRADFGTGFYRGNRRNTLSFDVRRDVDLDSKPFRDPEEAFVFALDHGDAFDAEGLIRLTLAGPKSSAIRWMQNAFVESSDLSQVLGVANAYSYTINAGAILKAKP